LPQFWD